MRILELHAENIKRIRVVTITPTGNVVRINGANESGKTSSLDAIIWAFEGAGSVDLVPVRQGEEHGLIRLKLGDDEVKLIVTRTFNASSGTTKLVVADPDGGVFPKPQQKVGDLFGRFSLDPQGFQRMNDRDRLDTLRQIVKLEIDVDEIDRQIAGDFERRTQVNRDIDAQRGRVATFRSSIVTSMVLDPIDTSEFLRQMTEASEADRKRAAEMRRRQDIGRTIETTDLHIASNEAEIFQLQARVNALIEQNVSMTTQNAARRTEVATWTKLPDAVDTASIASKIEEAQKANAAREKQRTARENHDAASIELVTLEAQRDDLTSRIEDRKRIKAAAIASAVYPVPGLSFGDGGVLFNGLPFNQASAAVQLRVSFAIAASMKPKLPVVLIKDGSLLDDKSMEMLEQLATEYGAQVWIERVGVDDVGIVLEDGEVVAVDGRPVDRLQSGELTQDAD